MTPRRWTAGVVREVLPNGLTLLVQRDDSAPVAAVVTHVKAGFFDEPDRWTGISHVLEHMFFKGTPRRGVGAIARETKAAGGYLNASTTYDCTSYFAVLPSRSLATAVDIQADALIHARIDADELRRELQVIIQEAKRKLDTPSAVAHEKLHELMFDRHRIRRWRIGYEQDLAGFTRDDVWGYYRSRYVPSRTIVALVGDVDPPAALELARRTYGAWPAAPAGTDPSPEEPPRTGVRARTLRGDVGTAELVLGWRTVPPLHPDSTALDLAAAVLASGRGSWLYRALRETGIATAVYAHNYAPTELGVFSVSAEFDADRLTPVLAGVSEEISRLALSGPGTEEMERARTLLLTRWARRMESMEGRASALASAEALDGVSLLDREYAELLRVSADEVRGVAQRYLRPEDVTGILFDPAGRGEDLTVDRLASAFALARLSPRGTPSPPTLAATPGRQVKMEITAQVSHVALPGADVLVRRKPGAPIATIGLYLPRRFQDPPHQAGLGALAVRSATRGAGGRDASTLAFSFERLGGQLGSVSAADWLGFSTTIEAGRIGEAARLLDLVHREPEFLESAVAAERSVMIDEAVQVADDMFRFPFQLAFRSAFGNQGYGLPVQGLAETLREISPDDVRRWHGSALATGRPVVVAVGDIEPQMTGELLAGIFGRYAPVASDRGFAAARWDDAATPRDLVVARQKAQSAVAMIFPGPARAHRLHYAAEVWAAIASGLGGRLFESLRDKRSLAYTVMATAWQRGRAGALATYIATSPEREQEAREAMLDDLERFGREPVTEAELDQARNYLAGQAEVERQHGSSLAAEILEAWLIGTGLDDLTDPAARFRAVTAGEVLEVARANLRREARCEGVVRGGSGVAE